MAEMTLEQKKAIALAKARLRLQQQGGSALDPIMQGASIGLSDELRGLIRGGGRYLLQDGDQSFGDLYAEERDVARQNLEAYRKRHPYLATGLEIGGAVLPAFATGGASLIPRAATTAGKIGLGAAEGAALGGAYGFNTAEGGVRERLKNVPVGAVTGAAGGAIGGRLAASVGRKIPKGAAPSLDDLQQEANAAFRKVDQSGAVVNKGRTDRMVNDLVAVASRAKLNPKIHPDSYEALVDVVGMRGQMPTISDLHQLRQLIADAAASPKPADRRIAKLMMEKLDDTIDGLSVMDMYGGDPKVTITALREGMDKWRRFRKGQLIADLFENAKDKVGANYTQAGMQTALRQEFRALNRQIRKNPKFRGMFSPEEKAAINKVVRGGRFSVENALRILGLFSPRGPITGIGYGATFGPGMMVDPFTFGAAGATAAGLTAGARQISTAIGKRNAQYVDELIRSGAAPAGAKPTAGQMLPPAFGLAIGAGGPPPLRIHLNAGERDRVMGGPGR